MQETFNKYFDWKFKNVIMVNIYANEYYHLYDVFVRIVIQIKISRLICNMFVFSLNIYNS